jgi:hypothetical protein
MTSAIQTSVDNAPASGYAGQLANVGPRKVRSAANSNAAGIAAGLIVFRSGERLVRPILASDEPSLVATAIMTSKATATTAQTLITTSLDGAVGQLEISPPKNLSLVLNSHADWDPSTIVVEGLDVNGETISEAFEVQNGGNVTLTGVKHFSFVTAVKIPPQTGTNGTITVGTGTSIGALDKLAAGVAVYDPMREPGLFAQYEDLSVLADGEIFVSAEGAVNEGDPVYVRIVATSETRGAVRATPDGVKCAHLSNAEFGRTTTGAGITVLRMKG